MALNVTFTCNANSIVDENGTPIDCQYQAYYVRQNIWNTTRTSDQQQFNFNAGDGDSLTQTGELKLNDVIIISLWQDVLASGSSSDTTSGLKTRFATFAIIHDGVTNAYIINPQLMPKMIPTCDWNFTSNQIIDESYTAIPLSDDEDSWDYQGNTFYHRRTYYTELIFDSVGNILDTYDFNNDGTFGSNDTNTYTSIADHIAHHKAENSYGLEQTCTKTIRTFYHVPTPDITFSPDMVINDIYYNDLLTVDYIINNVSRDIDSRVTGIDTQLRYIANDNSTITTDSVVIASLTDVQTTKTIDLLSRIRAYMTVNWNDGWNNQSFTYSEIRTVENTLPETTLSMTNLTARNKRFTHSSSDVDGLIVRAEYKLYLLMPFGAGYTEVSSITNTGVSLNDPVEVTFAQNGTYKMVLEVRDDANNRIPAAYGTDLDEIIFDIAITTCTQESYEAAKIEEIFFIFPDTNLTQ